MFCAGENHYTAYQDNFSKIPGAPVVYWVSNVIFTDFEKGTPIKELSRARRGLETGNNDKFLRCWWEVSDICIDFHCSSLRDFSSKWLPHHKGGSFRKYYGNHELVVYFFNNGSAIRQNGALNGYDAYLKSGITWTGLSSNKNSFRYTYSGFTFDSNKGPLIEENGVIDIHYVLGFLISKVGKLFISLLNSTISLQNGDMDKLPIIMGTAEENKHINECVKQNIQESKSDWDAFETSWDFRRHPLLPERDGETETRNQEFLAKLARADEQLRNGQTVVKTLEELQAMEEGEL